MKKKKKHIDFRLILLDRITFIIIENVYNV